MSKPAEESPLLDAIVDQFMQRVKALWEASTQDASLTLEDLETRVQALGREVLGAVLSEAVRRVPEPRPQTCDCGRRLRAKGRQKRQQETRVGALHWQREYYYCRHCRRGHYPLDERLEIAPGAFSASLQEEMALLGASAGSYPQAAALCAKLWQAGVSAKSTERVTKRRGARLGAARQGEAERLLAGEQPLPRAPEAGAPSPSHWAVGLDGVKVHFRDDWHEVVAGVVYGVGPQGRGVGPSYVATTAGLAAAGQGLYAETVRRGIDASQERLGCLGDGAPGNWRQFAEHFPHREEILDWYHAVEHLWGVGRALYGEGSDAAREWVKAREGELWAGRPEAVLAALEAASGQRPGGEVAAHEQGYFTTNAERMRYDRYRAEGWPIGSGTVESACKCLVAARLKGPGMRWSPEGAQAVLNLRVELRSGRWDEGWALTRSPA